MGGVVYTLNRTVREGVRKVTFGPRLEEEETGSHVDKRCSTPGRGNKCKDPGATLFLGYGKKSAAEAEPMRRK